MRVSRAAGALVHSLGVGPRAASGRAATTVRSGGSGRVHLAALRALMSQAVLWIVFDSAGLA